MRGLLWYGMFDEAAQNCAVVAILQVISLDK
jgi:hypothetical protein